MSGSYFYSIGNKVKMNSTTGPGSTSSRHWSEETKHE